MSFATSVQWFEDWQLRLLVLASLFLQYFLFAAAVVRKRRVPPWFRALIWLAYQGGDVVAVYALATLFNRHKEARDPAAAHRLDTLWAPVLLLHLGGQDGITAYSIEDNQNWRRYLLLAVCQITVVIYVFRKSWWSGDLLLLRAAILLLVPGILKCLEKPWALKNATPTSIINSSDSWMEETFDDDDDMVRKDIFSQEDYVQAAAECVAKNLESVELLEDEVSDQPYHLFVDLGHPYSIRLRNLQLMAPRAAATARRADVHGVVRSALSRAFDRLYTKHKASLGGLLRAAVVLLTFVDIGLFQRSHRGVYARADVVVTYILLCCTAALEFVSACLVLGWGPGLPPPDDQLAQYNLVGYLARAEKHPWFWALVRMLGARLQLDRLWCTAPPEPSLGITRLVYDYLADGWKDYIRPMDETARDHVTGTLRTYRTAVGAYRRFNDNRGQWTLKKEGCVGRSAIEESMRMPLDESVLLWHLATEFCYFDHVDTGNDATRHSRMVSNYMAYLLFVEPEMLIPGGRSKLFSATYRELTRMLKPPEEDDQVVEAVEPTEKKAPPPRAKNEMVRKVIQRVRSTIGGVASEDLVHKAWAVAHELMEFAELKKQEFIGELKVRGDKREKAMMALRCAKMEADEFIKVKMHSAQEKEKKVNDLSNNAGEIMDLKKEEEEKLVKAKDKAKEFIKEATEFIDEEKTKNRTKEEEGIMKLLESAKKAAEELVVANEPKLASLAIRQLEEEDEKLADLKEWHLIVNKEELLTIRSREHADDRMWAVIQGVWVEMLCFSAGRCRGYLHAKSLGTGGEYLSYVWLLLSYMGMETMPERMQRPELPTAGDTGGLVKTPTDDEAPALRRRRVNVIHNDPCATTPQPQATVVVPIDDDIV